MSKKSFECHYTNYLYNSGFVELDLLCIIFSGTALEALTSMQSFLRGRPTVFKSLEHAIEWRQVYYSQTLLTTVS